MSGTAEQKPRWFRVCLILLLYAGLFSLGHWGGGWITEWINLDLSGDASSPNWQMMIAGIVLYVLLMAIPFVPGMEISIALLAVFGPAAAIPVYIATLVALTLSCLIGQRLPIVVLTRLFAALGLQQAKTLVLRLEPLNAPQRLEILTEQTPKRLLALLLQHRYIAVIVALNTPGNALIGGGGGIALLAGISGLFSLPRFVIAVALAAAPVPLAILLISG
ncbi:MAG: hypothetical protein V7629_00325 [Motiliproteus sp.]